MNAKLEPTSQPQTQPPPPPSVDMETPSDGSDSEN